MGLTRKFLEGMGLEANQVSAIIDSHVEVVEGLKEQLESYKEEAGKYAEAQKALTEAQAELEKVKESDGNWKDKFDREHEAFESFKTAQSEKEVKTAKETAYRALLKESGISEKRIDTVLRVSDLSAIELVDGKVKDSDKVVNAIKTEWADFITETDTKGANTSFPPKNNSKTTDYTGMSMEEYIQARSNN